MAGDPDDIPAWQRLGGDTTTSGRLQQSDIARLADLGVRHIINLALNDSPGALAGEAGLVGAAGVAYTHIPVPFDAPGEAHFAAFCEAYDNGARPVHVHCIMNWRVSAFFYRYHLGRGMDPARARALMARQWDPATSDARDAAAWAAFIGATP